MKLDEAVLGVFMFRIILFWQIVPYQYEGTFFIYVDEIWIKFNFIMY